MPRLIVKATPADGDSIVELNRPRITIGRSARNDLCINDPFASRLHAEIRRKGDLFWLNDNGSANGTIYNGKRLTAPVVLNDGALISIGETVIQFSDRADTSPFNEGTRLLLAEGGAPLAPEVSIPAAASNSQSILLSKISTTHQNLLESASNAALTPQEDTLAIISRVSVTLLSPLSLEETIQQVLACVFDMLPADRAYLMLREVPAGNPKAAPELVCKAAKTRNQEATDQVQISRAITEQVVGQGLAILTSDAQRDPRFQDNQSIMLSGIRSVIAVPLAVEGRIAGMIYVDNPIHTNRFTQRDLQLLTLLASVAAIRIENMRLLEVQQEQQRLANELAVAAEIQLRLHPSVPPQLHGYDLMGVSFPCHEVGGDYFDFLARQEGQQVIALADVSGKGISAALLMSSVHAAVRAQCTTALTPEAIVREINQYIYDNTPTNRYVTMFYSELDPRTHQLTYINAGHNPPLLIRNSGEVVTLQAGGFPVGLLPDGDYEKGMLQLDAGDVLVIYSDGVTESQNEAGDEFGEERFLEVIQRNRGRTAAGLRDRIDEALQRFVGKAKSVDDLTLVIVKRKGPLIEIANTPPEQDGRPTAH